VRPHVEQSSERFEADGTAGLGLARIGSFADGLAGLLLDSLQDDKSKVINSRVTLYWRPML
jgi:hypothetical protein